MSIAVHLDGTGKVFNPGTPGEVIAYAEAPPQAKRLSRKQVAKEPLRIRKAIPPGLPTN